MAGNLNMIFNWRRKQYMADSEFESWESKLNCLLGLKRKLVGVTFFFHPDDYDSAQTKHMKTSMSYCAMVRMAACGHGRKAGAGHVRCPGARRALGLTLPDEDYLSGRRYLSLGLYKDLERAKETASQVSLMKDKVCGFSVGPFSHCSAPPHVVIAICDPNQAMRLVQGYIYHFGPLPVMGSLGTQGVCAELTVKPFQTRTPNVSLLCSNTRFTCMWEDGELGIGMPYDIFFKMIDGVERTLNAAEQDQKKKKILVRAGGLNRKPDVQLGTAYYL